MAAEFPDVVPGAGLEPARLAAGDFESPESTNFTTRAVFVKTLIMAYFSGEFCGPGRWSSKDFAAASGLLLCA